MKKYEASETLLVGDVDCTASGSSLCDEKGVEGFPTIKFGSPDDLDDYDGGRDSTSLIKFASTLKAMCGLNNIHLCDAERKAQITQMQAMSEAELTGFIETVDAEVLKVTAKYEQITNDLEAKMELAEAERKEKVQEIQQKGFNFAKVIRFDKFGIKYEKKSEEEGEGGEEEGEGGEEEGEGGEEDEGENGEEGKGEL